MDKIYENFFRDLLAHTDDLSEYVDSLYNGGKFSENELNQILGDLKRQGLLVCEYGDDRHGMWILLLWENIILMTEESLWRKSIYEEREASPYIYKSFF